MKMIIMLLDRLLLREKSCLMKELVDSSLILSSSVLVLANTNAINVFSNADLLNFLINVTLLILMAKKKRVNAEVYSWMF